MRRRRVLPVSLAVVALVSPLVGAPAQAGSLAPASTQILTWSGRGLVSDGSGGLTFSTLACDDAATPFATFVLSGTNASSATISVAGADPVPMVKVSSTRTRSTWKHRHLPGAPFTVSDLSGDVTVTYDGRVKGSLTLGDGCPGGSGPREPEDDRIITAGLSHTCSLALGGSVYCWGSNAKGQLGRSDVATTTSVPMQVFGVSGATAVTAGGEHTCAILTDGSVSCWGRNDYGQLGRGTVSDYSNVATLVSTFGPGTALGPVASLSGSPQHMCAVLTSGRMACWGSNSNGQLGDGTKVDRSTPTVVKKSDGSDLAGVRGGMARSNHSCALLSDGSAWCWGNNSSGQLGRDTGGADAVAPGPVGGISGASLLAGAGGTVCALVGTAVSCWGANGSGQLGRTLLSGTSTSTPGLVVGLSGATSLFGRNVTFCAILTDASLSCWGGNGGGQLGSGTVAASSVTPVAVVGISGATLATVGASHACAVVTGNVLKCWGENSSGQLGFSTGGSTSTTTPGIVTVGPG